MKCKLLDVIVKSIISQLQEKMKISSFLRASFACFTFAMTTHASAAILQVSSTGTLTGAKGVNVGGTLYDVTFEDGTCISIFSGCDAPSDFAFNTGAAATQAGNALLDQVFIDVAPHFFDSQPEKTSGCTNAGVCRVFIPYELRPTYVNIIVTNNFSGERADVLNFSASNRTDDTSFAFSASTYANFQLQRTEVPEPASIALFGLAFAAIRFTRRRKSSVPELATI
jgi:hypothetical protein